jgi:hypothetical protein
MADASHVPSRNACQSRERTVSLQRKARAASATKPQPQYAAQLSKEKHR